jgi:hypothetical protein
MNKSVCSVFIMSFVITTDALTSTVLKIFFLSSALEPIYLKVRIYNLNTAVQLLILFLTSF